MAAVIATRIVRLPMAFLALIGLLAIATGAAVATLTVTSNAVTTQLAATTVSADANTTVTSPSLSKASAAASAAGDSSPGIEATSGTFAAVNNALTQDNWTLVFDVKEASTSNEWSSSDTYKIEVFGDGALLTTLYFKNATATASTVEGVSVTVDLGSSTSIPDAYAINVSKQ